MPLSQPVSRELIHTRILDLRAYRRADGLWDIEGHLTDVKPFPYDLMDGARAADEPVHDMWLRLTLDRDFVIREAEATMDTGAHGICHLAAPNFAALAGLRIGPGWNRKVRERVGRGRGCTHLVEMLGQMATTAMQAMWAEQESEEGAEGEVPAGGRELKPGLADSCYAYRRESPFVKEYFPSSYLPPAEGEAAE
ncbi:MAG TPA: DUF2889 domain-containing protein [Alphaproteobacteria bacterium]|nr:DUF2889 domain-containing protein [Alphaproteobacteria bacterium]